MAYCTSANISDAIGGTMALVWLSDPTNTQVDSTAVASAIEFASMMIDQYAIGTPGATGTSGALWSSTPIQAKHCAISIAIYVLYERVRREVPQSVKDAYELAIEKLKALSKGEVSWVVTEDPAHINISRVMNVSSRDEPRDDSPRNASRWHMRTF